MRANPPSIAISDTTLCGRCGGGLAPRETEAVTCQTCLGSDLAEDLAEWFAMVDVPASQGLRAAGGFTLLEEIGHGGMGQVFRARQESPEREVAVKLLMPHLSGSEETRRRFLAEAEAMAELEHPGLLPLYACGETDGRPWLVTRLASGGNLAQRRREYSGQWRATAELTASLADAIQHAHARGIIHRDLKPSNVLFDANGGACIADFGLAKWRDDQLGGHTLSHAMMGTPAYMAPELAKNGARTATTAADVYGLGAILYELLTGRPPHTGQTPAEILLSLAGTDPPRLKSLEPEIPRDLEVICLRAIARDPAGRYETAAALAADLRRFLAGNTVSARPYSLLEKAVCWARRRPLAAGLTGALTAVLTVSAVIIVTRNAELRQLNADIVSKNADLRRLNTDLGAANAGWKTAADDAEDRVAYATESLPDKLAAFGRLDLLDDIFADAAEYYESPREIPAAERTGVEVRKAAFFVRWARIKHMQGKIPDAEAKLKEALELCGRITAQADAPAVAWATLARARRLSGLLALDKAAVPGEPVTLRPGELRRGHAAAEQFLNEAIGTADTGLERFPLAPELLVARAEAMTERCDLLISGEGGEPAALDALEQAWRLAVEKCQDKPARKQEYLRELTKVSYYRGHAAGRRRDWRAAEQHFRNLFAGYEALARLPDKGDEDERNIAIGCNRIARAIIGTAQKPRELKEDRRAEMEKLGARSREIMNRLMTSDPSNLQWRVDSAGMRLQDAWPYVGAREHDKSIPLLQEAVALIRNVPNEVSTAVMQRREEILNALAGELSWKAGAVSQAVKRPGTASEAEVLASRQASIGLAEATLAASLEAFPCAVKSPDFHLSIPERGIDLSWRILAKHGAADLARQRLSEALATAGPTPGLTDFLNKQLFELNAPGKETPEPPNPASKPDNP